MISTGSMRTRRPLAGPFAATSRFPAGLTFFGGYWQTSTTDWRRSSRCTTAFSRSDPFTSAVRSRPSGPDFDRSLERVGARPGTCRGSDQDGWAERRARSVSRSLSGERDTSRCQTRTSRDEVVTGQFEARTAGNSVSRRTRISTRLLSVSRSLCGERTCPGVRHDQGVTGQFQTRTGRYSVSR